MDEQYLGRPDAVAPNLREWHSEQPNRMPPVVTIESNTVAAPSRIGVVPWKTIWILSLLAAGSFFIDQIVSTVLRAVDLPGDVDQELRALQQFGQIGWLIIITVAVCLAQPPLVRRTLLDLGLAVLIASQIALQGKILIGRVRPTFGSPDEFHGIFSSGSSDMSWSQVASMPSSHTMAAAVLATWIAMVFPRLRWIGFVLVAIVGISRIRFGNHWPSDVLIGAAIGFLVGGIVIGRLLGTRLLDVLWRLCVDRNASPAAPEVAQAILSRNDRGKA